MRFKILQRMYTTVPLTKFKPKSLKYRSNCKKLEQLHTGLQATLNPEQMKAVDEYVDVIFQQALAEQKQSFYCGIRVGIGFMKEVQSFDKEEE